MPRLLMLARVCTVMLWSCPFPYLYCTAPNISSASALLAVQFKLTHQPLVAFRFNRDTIVAERNIALWVQSASLRQYLRYDIQLA